MPPKKSESATEPLSEHAFSQSVKEIKTLIKESEQRISSKLKRVDERLGEIYDELRGEMDEVKEEVGELKIQVENIKSQVDGVEKSIGYHASKVDDMQKEQEEKMLTLQAQLNEKINDLNKHLLHLEKHDRKYNLVFNGIVEERNEKLYEKMREFFVRSLQIDAERVEQMYFCNGHRLPVDSKFTGPKPVIMRFSNYEDRELVLSHANKLAGSGKSIVTDLPVVMKRERQKLARVAYGIRQNEKLKTRIRDRGLEMILEVRRDSSDKWVERKV